MKRTTAGKCPSEEALCGFADGTLREERAEVEAHLAHCERCLSIVSDMIVSAQSLAGAELRTPPLDLERQVQGRALQRDESVRAPSWLGRLAHAAFSYRAAAAVAAVSIVALLAVWVGQSHRYPLRAPSGVRERETTMQRPVPIEPRGQILAGQSVRFLWEGCPRVETYVLTIINADSGSVVLREAVSRADYLLPVARLAESGGEHFEWMVECTLKDGALALSPAVPFHLSRSVLEE